MEVSDYLRVSWESLVRHNLNKLFKLHNLSECSQN